MLKEYLSTIANAIRSKLGSTAKINAQNFADKIGEVYDAGYNSAVREGTVTFTETSKILSISGLPSEPKELHLLAFNAYTPTNDNDAFVGALNYIRDGFSYGGTAKIKAAVWLRLNAGAANGSIAEKIANQNNVFKFENGAFEIDLTYSTKYCFGENYTYKWTAIF